MTLNELQDLIDEEGKIIIIVHTVYDVWEMLNKLRMIRGEHINITPDGRYNVNVTVDIDTSVSLRFI